MRFVIFFLLLGFAAGAQQAPLATKHLSQTTYDFGMIPQGKPVYTSFVVENKTATPLVLENVQASCGCTTPEWKRDPIPAGGRAEIKVGYNAASEGPFNKTITVLYAGGASEQMIIQGNVWRAPATPAPANASVQFLKQQLQ